MNPKISVVIPVYNGAKFISKTIESVLNQNYRPHEIIVIDDGSTDDTPKILKSFENKIISKRIKNSGGSSIPKNVGMGMATGDYVAFLDADDLWFKDKLKKQAEYILKYPNAGLICCDFAVRRHDQNLRLKKHFSLLRYLKEINFNAPLKVAPFRLLLKGNFVSGPSTVVIKKEIIERVGEFRGDVSVFAEDYDYWLRCAVITDFIVVSDILVYKRTHTGNLSNDRIRFYTRHGGALKRTMHNMSFYLEENNLLEECQLALADNYYHLGNSYFETAKIRTAFAMYFKGLLNSKSFKNLGLFMRVVSKKLIRLATFNTFARNKIIKRIIL